MKIVFLFFILLGVGITIFGFILVASIFTLIIFELDLLELIKNRLKELGKFLRSFKCKNKLEKQKKVLEKNFQKKYLITLETLKFEYATIYNIVKEEVSKIMDEETSKKIIATDTYLMKLYEYHMQVSKIRVIQCNSLEFFTCIWLAIRFEPIFYEKTGNFSKARSENEALIKAVFKSLKQNFPDVYYDNVLVTDENSNEILYMCSKDTSNYYKKEHNFCLLKGTDEFFFDYVMSMYVNFF